MSNLIHTKEELNAFINEADFVERTCQQLLKDLSQIYHKEVNFYFDEDTSLLEQLQRQLSPIIEEISRMGSGLLLQLMYTVDIPESDYIKSIEEKDFAVKLSYLVIRREAQKVYLKNKFS